MRREHAHMAIDVLFNLSARFGSSEASGHFRAARREALLGVRALIDAALARQEAQAGAEGEAGRPTSIPVEE